MTKFVKCLEEINTLLVPFGHFWYIFGIPTVYPFSDDVKKKKSFGMKFGSDFIYLESQ